MQEERAERKHSLKERCEKAVEIANAHNGQTMLWVDLDIEGNTLEKMLDDVVQIRGPMKDEAKEEAWAAFLSGQIKNLITKPKIGAWGINAQNCHNVVSFPTHSAEQDYQLVRRCWRFGQLHDVTMSRIVCEGERGVLDNLRRKRLQIEQMFGRIVEHMGNSLHMVTKDYFPETEEIPAWLA